MLKIFNSLMFLWKHERSLLPKQAKAFGFTRVTCELPVSVPICRSQLPALELRHYQKGNTERSNLTSTICCKETVMFLSLSAEVIQPKTLVCGRAGLVSIIRFESKTIS